MNYVQKLLDQFHIKENDKTEPNSSNVLLYCNHYSFYSQKVLMALYEKNVDFEPYIIDITKGEQYSSWFLKINPSGEIPVLKVDNDIIPDSTRILDYLDKYFNPDLPSLTNVSSDPKVLNNIAKFRELIEALPAGVITVGSFFFPHLCGRPKLPFILPIRERLKSGDLNGVETLKERAEENPEAKHILLYKAKIQEKKREIITHEDEYLKVLNVVDQVLEEVENQLKDQLEGNWLCCDQFTMADINLSVLLQRLWELGLEDRFWTGGLRPLVEQYYHRVAQRESFRKTIPGISDHVKIAFSTQPPASIGVAGLISVGIIVAVFCVIKKLVHS